MKLLVVVIALLILVVPTTSMAQFQVHKSEAEIARMGPEQRVKEYRSEFLRHSYGDEYERMLSGYIVRDGLRAVPQLIEIISEYDPRESGRSAAGRATACYGAEGLLAQIDENAVRLRGSEDGRKAIDAMGGLVQRMESADFDRAEGKDYGKQMRYKGTRAHLEHMQGLSWRDVAIKETLDLRYQIRLSSKEMLSFVEYLISQDSTYPSWSQTEWYKDRNNINEAGIPLQYVIVKNIEPFYNLYRQYNAKAIPKLYRRFVQAGLGEPSQGEYHRAYY